MSEIIFGGTRFVSRLIVHRTNHTKIAKFKRAVGHQEYIAGLHIPMDTASRMKILKCAQKLIYNITMRWNKTKVEYLLLIAELIEY